jgi:hypothetical protein
MATSFANWRRLGDRDDAGDGDIYRAALAARQVVMPKVMPFSGLAELAHSPMVSRNTCAVLTAETPQSNVAKGAMWGIEHGRAG